MKIYAIFVCTVLIALTSCGGGSSAGGGTSTLNMDGTWTVTTKSTQGHGTFSGTATITQSGSGIGVAGNTTLSAPIGKISMSQTGTEINGSITNSIQAVTYNFIGTVSKGTFTISGSTRCAETTVTETTSISGTITSNSVQGTYTISRPSPCYYSSDAGTFVATKN